MSRVAADGIRVLPAALALLANSMSSSNAKTLNGRGRTALTLDQLHMGNDHQVSQLVHGDAVQQVIDGIVAVQGDSSLQRSTNGLLGTGLLQHFLDLITHGDELCPLGLECLIGRILTTMFP